MNNIEINELNISSELLLASYGSNTKNQTNYSALSTLMLTKT